MKVLAILAVLAIANTLQQGYCNSSEEDNGNFNRRTNKFQTQEQLGRTATENEAFDFQQFESQLKDMDSENMVLEFHHSEPNVGPQPGGIIKRRNAKKKRANVAFALQPDKYEYYPTTQNYYQEEQDECSADCSEAMHFENYSDDFGTEFSLQLPENVADLGLGSRDNELNMENVLTNLFSNIHFVPSNQEQAHFNEPSENIPSRAEQLSPSMHAEDGLQESNKFMDRSSDTHNNEDECLLGNIFKNSEYEDSFGKSGWNERSSDDDFLPDTSTPTDHSVSTPFDNAGLLDTKKRWDIFRMHVDDECCKLENTESEQDPLGTNSKYANQGHSVKKLSISTPDQSNPSNSAISTRDNVVTISSDDLISFTSLPSNINNEIESENCISTKKLNIIEIDINAQFSSASVPQDNSLYPKDDQDDERLSDDDSILSPGQQREEDKNSSLLRTGNKCSTSTCQNVPRTLNENQSATSTISNSQMWQWEIYDSSESIASDKESIPIQSDTSTELTDNNFNATSIEDETKSISESVATERLIPEPAFDRLRKSHNLDESADVAQTQTYSATIHDDSMTATVTLSSTPLALPVIRDCSNDGIECECNTKPATLASTLDQSSQNAASTLDQSSQNGENGVGEEEGATWFGALVGMIRRIFGNLFQ